MVRALASDSRGHKFDSRPLRCQVTTLGKLFTQVPPSLSITIWYQLQGTIAPTYSSLGMVLFIFSPRSVIIYKVDARMYQSACGML